MTYVLEGYKFGTGGLGASGGTVTYSFATSNFSQPNEQFQPYNYTGFLTGQFQTEVRAALAAWEAVANIHFVEVADSTASNLRFGFVDVFPSHWGSTAQNGGVGGIAGQANVFLDNNPNTASPAHVTDADIAFDRLENWQVVNGEMLTGPGGTRFLSIAEHEIGHALGLDHDTADHSIMQPSLDPSYKGLEAVDIQGAQAIYGAAAAQPVAGSVAIGDAIIAEGNNGTQQLVFTVARTGGTAAFNVNYATADGTATTADGDYVAKALTTLAFAAGEMSKTVSVTINGDTKVEGSETFNINLSGATNGATISDGTAVGTISNDDVAAVAGSVAIGDAIIAEGNNGTQQLVFTVARTGGTAAFNVNYATADGTATTADGDYVAKALTTLAFAAGEMSKTVSVTINGDTKVEGSETFNINLSGATNGATISDGTAVGTISNDDVAAVAGSVAIGDAIIAEGNNGTQQLVFTVARTGGTAAFNVNYATADGTATTADGDYVAKALTTLAFAAGEMSKTVSVTINGDTKVEGSETFNINLSGATNGATISDGTAVGTISNDDVAAVAGSVAIGDAIIAEGNNGTQQLVFTVARTGGTAAFNVNYATADGTATTADGDYVAKALTTLAFAAGEMSKTVSVTINGDTKVEGSETFNINLSGATNGATISDGTGAGTISNDDVAAVAGSVSINDVTIIEGDAGTKVATFTVTRTGGTAAFDVVAATAAGTASGAANDYVAKSETLSFGANVNSQTFSVTINGDTAVEGNETFNVNLSGATNGATISDGTGVGTISNDDSAPINTAPVVTANDFSVGINGSIAASSMFVANDQQGNNTITQYAFWDGGSNGGHFTINGVTQASGVWVYANASDLGTVKYVGGPAAGSESLFVAAYDGQVWSDYDSLTAFTNNTNVGTANADNLIGDAADNVLDGKGGADTMAGGLGNDIYYVDNAGDRVVEKAGEGSDTVYASIDYTIGTNVEAVVLTGSANLNAAGNDQVNALIGNSGNNNLDGHGGDDYMVGGAGNDIYFVDSSSDVVVENANEGADIVYASIDYTIGANVESVVLTGSANLNAAGGNTGNALIGNSGNNALDGRGGGDYLVGNGGNDTFVFSALQANGDIVADFDGHGASAGDSLRFIGYGSAAQGAAFTQIDGTHWQIHSGIDGHNETLMLQNGASVHASDYSFV